MRPIECAVFLLAGMAASAQAANWVEAGSKGGTTAYYDTDSAKLVVGHVDFWGKIVYTTGHQISDGSSRDKMVTFVEMRSHYDIDCTAQKMSASEVQFYDATGVLVRTMLSPPIPPVATKPASFGGIVAGKNCAAP
jgi:hypothetical protein